MSINSIINKLPTDFQDKLNNLEEKVNCKLSPEEQLNWLLTKYCENCGINFSYRSVYYDLANMLYQRIFGNEELDDYANKNIPNWSNYKEYNCVMAIEQTITTALEIILKFDLENVHSQLMYDALIEFITRYEGILMKVN